MHCCLSTHLIQVVARNQTVPHPQCPSQTPQQIPETTSRYPSPDTKQSTKAVLHASTFVDLFPLFEISGNDLQPVELAPSPPLRRYISRTNPKLPSISSPTLHNRMFPLVCLHQVKPFYTPEEKVWVKVAVHSRGFTPMIVTDKTANPLVEHHRARYKLIIGLLQSQPLIPSLSFQCRRYPANSPQPDIRGMIAPKGIHAPHQLCPTIGMVIHFCA